MSSDTDELGPVESSKPLEGEIIAPRPVFKYKTPPTTDWRPPLLELNEATLTKIYNLAQLQVTQKEAAAALGCSASLFEKFIQTYPEAKAKWWEGRASGKLSLRRLLWRQAMTTPAVAMFLAKDKRWLNMESKAETNIDNRTIIFTDEQNVERIKELAKIAKSGKRR